MAQPEIKVTKPNPEMWKAALKAADGDVSRIRVLSETEIVVDNKPRDKRGPSPA